MRRRQILNSSLAAVSASLLPSLVRAQEHRRILLGQSASLTGPTAQLGLQMRLGARLCFDAVNAAGGVNGLQIELKTVDDGYDPDRCKANTQAFIEEDAFALFGYVGTPTTLMALPMATQAKIPLFAPMTGAQALREPMNRWVFHVRASYVEETALIVKQLTQLGLDRIAVFRQNDSYGKAGLEGVQLALAARGQEPTAVYSVERASLDVNKAVANLMNDVPEAVVLVSVYKSCAAFIRAARKAGYGGVFYNVSFVGTQALLDELGKDAAGVVVSQVMPYPFGAATGIVAEYQAALQKAGIERASYISMEGYLAAKVFTEGLRRAGKANREGFVTALEGLQNFNPGGFPLHFSPTRHAASSFVELSMLTGDGKIKH